MAFLTFRQSDSTVTEAQTQRHHVILGVPLSMYHVDANFKAINDQLDDYKTKYGLSVGQRDTTSTLASLFGTNSANSIVNTGFYQLNASSNVPTGVDSSVLIHAQGTGQDINAVTAIQFTASATDEDGQMLYYRTKQGQNTWNPWQSFANSDNLQIAIDQLQDQLSQLVDKRGDTITGPLTVTNNVTLTGTNYIISDLATKGTTPSTNSSDGFTVYDRTGTINDNTKLGFFGFKQQTNSFSGLSLSAVNPVTTGSALTTEILVGWKQDDNGQYAPYTYAPTPTSDDDEPNQIATTGWVSDQLENFAFENGSLVAGGGTIGGDTFVQGSLDVYNTLTVESAVVRDNVVILGEVAQTLQSAKGNIPSVNDPAVENGYRIVDSTRQLTDEATAGQFWTSVDHLGNTIVSIRAYGWNEGVTDYGSITITASADGQTYTTSAPTPVANSNDTSIATTEWVRTTASSIANQLIDQFEAEHPWDLGVL